MFLNLKAPQNGPNLMNIVMPNVLAQLLEKLSKLSPKQQTLRKTLFGTLMSAVIHNPALAIQSLF